MKKLFFMTWMLFAVSIVINAQIQVSRQYTPIDLDVRIKRCVVSGNQGYIDLVFTNYTGKCINDIFVLPYNGNVKYPETVAYDDEGNVYFYEKNMYKITFGGKDGQAYHTLPEEVSVKMRIELKDISEFSTEFTMLNIVFRGISSHDHVGDGSITFRKIPITRLE